LRIIKVSTYNIASKAATRKSKRAEAVREAGPSTASPIRGSPLKFASEPTAEK